MKTTKGVEMSGVSDRSKLKRSREDDSEEDLLQSSSAVRNQKLKSSESNVSSKLSAVKSLLEWFQANGFTGLDNVDFKISQTCNNTLGCFAKKSFHKGEVLFTIPQSHIIGQHEVLDSEISQYILKQVKELHLESKISLEFLYWLFLISAKEQEKYGEYLNSLSAESPSLLNWDSQMLLLLEDTNLAASISDLKDSIDRYVEVLDTIRKNSPKEAALLIPAVRFNKTSLIWAAGHYLSRRYPAKFGINVDESLRIEGISKEKNLGNLGTMVPLLDILNHDHEEEWLRLEVRQNSLVVLCNHSVREGQELFSNYGDLSNGQLLFAYGYALVDNPNDDFLVKLKLPLNVVAPGSEETGDNHGLYLLKKGGWDGIPRELFTALKMMLQLTSGGEETEEGEEMDLLLSYVSDKIMKLKSKQSSREEFMKQLGYNFRLTFPDTVDDLVNSSVFNASSTFTGVGDPRAAFIANYLIGQYDIMTEVVRDLVNVFETQQSEDDE